MRTNCQNCERDPLFSAAEIVQDSADRMECIYRALLQGQSFAGAERSEIKLISSVHLHMRDLLTAIGTTKWQLEDFEKAVVARGVSGKSNFNRDTILKHDQFVRSIREQKTPVEKNLNYSPAGKSNFNNRLINLNKQDRDHLALFLSGGYTSEHIGYDLDKSNIGACEVEPCASVLDDDSDEITELKTEDTPDDERNMHAQTNYFRHSAYGIQLKSAPNSVT